ncbi:helix-turn-helix transcriptional regulator [Planctomonas sp. JC2975]|uniref:helix-turn-helix transcriptional regulator n=1 Tax=Planctomonas sp. JC2975 TaxID=2729626 RepID=UPI0014742D3F|nr:helix-turn-helix transcriptional regulator [Planctomonas sp. JC2975]NNC13997.1 helix-turn-helix transcriptional regulator [Planctomonas sp. JC2975]
MDNRIRTEREQREWTQAGLAEHLEVSRQTVVALETGKYDPSLPLAFRIAGLFGKPIEQLFFPTGVRNEQRL